MKMDDSQKIMKIDCNFGMEGGGTEKKEEETAIMRQRGGLLLHVYK